MISRSTILDRVIEPQRGSFSTEHAQYVLSLGFSAVEQSRFAELSERVQQQNLSEEEQIELDEFLSVNALLVILQSKARVSLKKHNSAA